MLPKTELHLHLGGSVDAKTFVDLAGKHDLHISTAYDEPEDLYDYDNLVDFLKIYSLISQSCRGKDDFHRITYECLSRCAEHGARYVELFFSPEEHLKYGVSYQTILDGIIAGAKDAEKDTGVIYQLIPAINRELGPERAIQFVTMVCAYRRDDIIGIGLDFDESANPPEVFEEAFKLAAKNGLHKTSHEGEVGPASNVVNSIDVLGCERVDHGYHIVDDIEHMERFVEEQILFTVCPVTTTVTTRWRDLDAEDHAIRLMADAGLKIMINSDDPPMLHTDLTNEYMIMMDKLKFGIEDIKTFILNGIDGAWLDDSTKRQWRSEWSAEIDKIILE